jgi:hypothetical protein
MTTEWRSGARARLLAALLAALALPAFAAGPAVPDDMASPPEWWSMHLQAARADGDALSAIEVAGVLLTVDCDEAADVRAVGTALRSDALARAGDDPAVLALALSAASAAEKAAWRPKLEAAAADNAYYALVLLAAEGLDGDPATRARLIALGARAPRFEGPQGRLMRGMFERNDGIEFPPSAAVPASRRRGAVFALTMAMTAMSGVGAKVPFRTCKDATGTLRDDCRALARRWRDDARYSLDAMLADVILRDTAVDEEARRAALADKRELHWQARAQMQGFGADPDAFFETAAGLRYMETYLANGELAAVRELLEPLGLLHPPADWNDTP